MGIPDAAVLLPALHLDVVDRAGRSIAILIGAVATGSPIIALGLSSIAIAARAEGEVVAGRAASLEQVGDGGLGFVQQFLAGIGTQGDLAGEALGRGVLGVPGSRGFGDEWCCF